MSKNMYLSVKKFHKTFGLNSSSKPKLPDESERELRRRLLEEEFKEYCEAEDQDDIVEIAKELSDVIYIACGTAVSYGIPLHKVFDAVHASNMDKLIDGKVKRREDGKVLKPDNWEAPDIESVVFKKKG